MHQTGTELFRESFALQITSNIHEFYVLLTVHVDIIVYRKANLMHNLVLVYFVDGIY